MDLYALAQDTLSIHSTPLADRYLSTVLNGDILAPIIKRWPQAYQLIKNHIGAIYVWEKGRLLDPGWANVIEHQVISGLVASALGHLCYLSENDINTLVFFALIHDADKRYEVENKGKKQIEHIGNLVYVDSNTKEYEEEEKHKRGLLAVTGSGAKGYKEWNILQMILRLTDSYVGPSGVERKDDIVDFQYRIADLRRRHPQLTEWWDELEYVVQPFIENKVYGIMAANKRNNEFIQKYDKSEDLAHIAREYLHLQQS